MKIVFNENDSILSSEFECIIIKADKVNIVTAFFSSSDVIKKWINDGKIMNLLVSLRPPTNYYSLKEILPYANINTKFLGKQLHSKIYLFYKDNIPFASIVGSSNFTNGGLVANIESNVIIDESCYLNQIDQYFNRIFDSAPNLEPIDIENYKKYYDNFIKRKSENDIDDEEFNKKTNTKSRMKLKGTKINSDAKKYYDFWKIVDDVKETIRDLSDKEYKGIPYYITIDHFWHWIKKIWDKDRTPDVISSDRKNEIRRLFELYIKWDKSGDGQAYTQIMNQKSITIFKKYLSVDYIDKLTLDEALEIYRNLHSTDKLIKRFNYDEKFKINEISKIIKSWKYLLYSNDDIVCRISNLINKDSGYHLSHFGKSNIQELNGWVHPEKYPIRNEKADEAVNFIGYKL